MFIVKSRLGFETVFEADYAVEFILIVALDEVTFTQKLESRMDGCVSDDFLRLAVENGERIGIDSVHIVPVSVVDEVIEHIERDVHAVVGIDEMYRAFDLHIRALFTRLRTFEILGVHRSDVAVRILFATYVFDDIRAFKTHYSVGL